MKEGIDTKPQPLVNIQQVDIERKLTRLQTFSTSSRKAESQSGSSKRLQSQISKATRKKSHFYGTISAVPQRRNSFDDDSGFSDD